MLSQDGAAPIEGIEQAARVYCVCLFERGAVVPEVKLVDATSDDEAVAIARAINPTCEREVWDRHRLVAHFPAAAMAS